MAMTIANGDAFRKACAENNITELKLAFGIASYVDKNVTSASQCATSVRNLRKELGRAAMSDKVLAKGLAIIELAKKE